MKRLVLLAYLFFAGSLAAEIPQLRWPAIEGAGGYLVEIRTGQTVVSRTVTVPEFDIALAPGDYQLRITTLDRFLKPAGRTDWVRFSVARAITPAVTAVQPNAAEPGETRFVVEGSGFTSSTDVVLVDEQGEVKAARGQLISDSRLEFSATLAPGTYTVVLTNPPGQTARLPGGVTVAPLPEPQVVQIPEPLPNPPVHPLATPAPRIPWRFGGGYGVVVPLGAWSAVLGPSYQDAEAFALWPLWSGSGPLVRVGYTGFNSRTGMGLVSSRLNVESLAAGVSWNLPSLPLRVWLTPGMTLTQASIAGDSTGSTDFSVGAGASVVFPVGDQLFWELGSDYRLVFYTGVPLQSIGVTARTGFRF